MENTLSNKILPLVQYIQLIRAQFKSIKRIAPLMNARKLVHFLSFAQRKRSVVTSLAMSRSNLKVKSFNHQTQSYLCQLKVSLEPPTSIHQSNLSSSNKTRASSLTSLVPNSTIQSSNNLELTKLRLLTSTRRYKIFLQHQIKEYNRWIRLPKIKTLGLKISSPK